MEEDAAHQVSFISFLMEFGPESCRSGLHFGVEVIQKPFCHRKYEIYGG